MARTFLTDRQAAKAFSTLVERIPRADLAKAADRTGEAAKGWKAARCCPSGASLINMARELPEVRAWLLAMIGLDAP